MERYKKIRTLREIFKIDQMKLLWKKGNNEGRCDGVKHYVWHPTIDHLDMDGACDCKKEDRHHK